MNVEELKKKLSDEGYPVVYEWEDKPGTKYEKHFHKDKVTIFVIEGDITFNFEGQIKKVSAGERFDVPPNTEHSAVVGENGCKYVVGQMSED